MIGTYRMVRGDRRRLPSWDTTEFIQLDVNDNTDKDVTEVPDLTDRTVDLALVTQRYDGERIVLSNAVEVGDPTAGEVAITLEESDTAVPIEGDSTNLYGEFRLDGGSEDPTTAGVIKIKLAPSRHDVEGEAVLMPYREDFGAWADETGTMDAEGASIANVNDFGGTSATVDSVDAGEAHTTQLTSESLPRWRVYNDGTDIVAIDESDVEIARGTDATTVWQAAIDAANASYDPDFKEFPVAHIDGGGLWYNINSSLTIKSGAGVSNVKFDMINAGTGAQITVGGPDTGFSVGGGWLQTAEIHNPPQPVRFRDLVYAKLGPIYVRDAVNDGAVFQGVIGCDIDINVKNTGGDGMEFNNGGQTGTGNSNRVRARANSCGGAGIVNLTARNTVFNKAISEACTGHGIVDSGEGCLWLNPTTEVNDGYGFYSNATKGHYIAPHSNQDTQGRFRFTGSSTNCVFRGPVRTNGALDVAAPATDITITNVDPANLGSIGGNRTVINGTGTNGANDPSVAGEWNGNGRRGITVVWDDGAGTNYASKYLADGWRQIASW